MAAAPNSISMVPGAVVDVSDVKVGRWGVASYGTFWANVIGKPVAATSDEIRNRTIRFDGYLIRYSVQHFGV